jgi:hypothetical protein
MGKLWRRFYARRYAPEVWYGSLFFYEVWFVIIPPALAT